MKIIKRLITLGDPLYWYCLGMVAVFEFIVGLILFLSIHN